MAQTVSNGDSGLVARTIINEQMNNWYNVETYGANHDYQTVSDANVTSGTATLTSATAAFTSADTGKAIRVCGAGAAGADLLTTITYVNATTVTLGTNASTTITAKRIEWGTNDTVGIQAAIQACHDNGGGTVYFPNGIYFLTSALGASPNSQIYIPTTTTSQTMTRIELLGEAVIGLPNSAITPQSLPTKGVILKSAILGSGTLPAVIASASPNLTIVVIRNICIQTRSITGTTHIAPTMSAFALNELEAKIVENCFAETESDPTESIVPSAVTYGFYYSQQLKSDVASWYNNNGAMGYYYGHRMDEHDVFGRLSGYACFSAVAFGGDTNYNPQLGGVIANIWCKYGITFLGPKTVNISYYSEQGDAALFGSKWFNITADIYYPSGVTVNGDIKATSLTTGTSTHPAVSTSGTNLGNLRIWDLTNNTVKSVQSDVFNIISSIATGRAGILLQNSAAGAQATVYLQNDRGAFASYGGQIYGGTTNSVGNLFGVSRVDKYFIFADGASNLGMAIGTLSAQPLILGTNNAENMRIISGGQVGVGVTSPTTKLHTTAFATAYIARTTTYPITASDYTIECTSGTFTTTLPTAVGITGRQYFITNSGAGTITLATTSSQTFINVSGTPTSVTLNQFNGILVQSNGANWIKIASF